MAQRVTTMLTCDWPHGGKEVEATTTMHFTFEATQYEVDVCPMHVEKARRLVGQVTEHARTVKGTKAAPLAKPKRTRASTPNEVREWAKAQGLWSRGRVSNHIVERYEAAHASA